MNKNASITIAPETDLEVTPSPCEHCGNPARVIHDGVPLCSQHASVSWSKNPTRPAAIEKVASDLSNNHY